MKPKELASVSTKRTNTYKYQTSYAVGRTTILSPVVLCFLPHKCSSHVPGEQIFPTECLAFLRSCHPSTNSVIQAGLKLPTFSRSRLGNGVARCQRYISRLGDRRKRAVVPKSISENLNRIGLDSKIALQSGFVKSESANLL